MTIPLPMYSNRIPMRTVNLSLGGRALAVMVLALLLAGCGINTIPDARGSRAKARWSEVQNQYQRRADLVPNLVETVNGYAKQEQEMLTAGHRGARQGDASAGQRRRSHRPGDVQAIPGGAGATLRRARPPIAVSENYPDLKSNQNFLALQSQLEGTENRIASRGATTSRRCRPTTPRCAPSRGGSGPWIYGASRWRRSRPAKRTSAPPTVKF